MPRRDNSGEGSSGRRKPAGRNGARSTSSRSDSRSTRGDSKKPFKSSRSDSKDFKSPRGGKSYGRSKDDSSEKPARAGNFRKRSEGSGSSARSEKPFTRSRDDRDDTKRPSRFSDKGDSKDSSKPLRESRSYGRPKGDDSTERPSRGGNFRNRSEGSGSSSRGEKPFTRSRDDRDDSKKPFRSSRGDSKDSSKPPRESRSYSRPKGDDSTERPSREGNFKRRSEGFSKEDKPVRSDEEREERRSKFSDKDGGDDKKGFFSKLSRGGKSFTRTAAPAPDYGKAITKGKDEAPADKIRLNRYISNSGVCSRREADEFIKMGLVSVNGTVITEMGYKVDRKDVIKYEGKTLRAEKPVYILMNKPKGFLTTTKDPQDRNTVMQILAESVKERVYPVGRLDRNTTGLLLLTNDGELTDKLSHPSYNVKKIYKVDLDKPLTKADFEKIKAGVHLEEGRAIVDDLALVSDDAKTIGIELHIGWNRVIRRIFESLGYEVVKLDRSVYAGLDKKDLSRGHWRHLTREEVVRLKHYK
jgi:23S rRNA pseudouridine2605 synthase